MNWSSIQEMNNFELITTDRLLVRTLEMHDKEDMFAYRSMPEVYQFQMWNPKDVAEIEDFILKNSLTKLNTPNTWLQVAICLKDLQMIGDIGIHFLEDDFQVEIGYTVSPKHQGKGYAIEAVRAVMNYLFTTLSKHRITASVDPNNKSSIKLLEKIGFRKEAHFVKSFKMNDGWHDDCIYAILEEEWK